MNTPKKPKPRDAAEPDSRRHLVQTTAEKLREWILSLEPETQLGSLRKVSAHLGVGIVTLQQAARILEHEGLLAVRRGPGGGYYGTRPDEAALERSFATYMRVHGFGYWEVFEMTSLLDCEIIPAAANCSDKSLRDLLRALGKTIDSCNSVEQRVAFETEFRDLLFKMVARPLIELITRASYQMYKAQPESELFLGEEGVAAWKAGKRRIVQAILEADEELAAFEALRNRRQVLSRMRGKESAGSSKPANKGA